MAKSYTDAELQKKVKDQHSDEGKRSREQEDEEHLRQVDTEEGPEFIRQIEDEKKKVNDLNLQNISSVLNSKRRSPIGYRATLRNYGNGMIIDSELDKGWGAYFVETNGGKTISVGGRTFDTKEGLVMILKAPNNKSFARAIQVIYDPAFDVNAVHVLLEQLDNTIDSEKGLLLDKKKDSQSGFKKTEAGIYIPE